MYPHTRVAQLMCWPAWYQVELSSGLRDCRLAMDSRVGSVHNRSNRALAFLGCTRPLALTLWRCPHGWPYSCTLDSETPKSETRNPQGLTARVCLHFTHVLNRCIISRTELWAAGLHEPACGGLMRWPAARSCLAVQAVCLR